MEYQEIEHLNGLEFIKVLLGFEKERFDKVNDAEKYKNRYFEPILKILDYLKPKNHIFINGFKTFEQDFKKSDFQDIIEFSKEEYTGNKKLKNSFYIGKIDKRFKFIGLPFLTRVRGGKDALADSIKLFLQNG